MIIYYFNKTINKPCYRLGSCKEKRFTSKCDLINYAINWLNVDSLSQEELNAITTEEIPDYDFYSIQSFFCSEIYTEAIFKTMEEAQEYIKKKNDDNMEIVGQYWGEYNCLYNC